MEGWVILNTTVDMHPIHLHLVAYEVLERGSHDPSLYPTPSRTRSTT
jgi:spore coat protein A